MKYFYLILSLSAFLFSSCESDSTSEDDTSLIDKSINVTLSGTRFADLINFTGNDEFIIDNIDFIEGVYLFNNGTDFFTALELAEPNDPFNICDTPTSLTNGQFVYDCDGETRIYNIAGQRIFEEGEDANENNSPMRQYRAVRSNGTLTITF